ncbi:MAG: hypothetical protein PUD20_01250 [bacterium]|nr:hypothetical protein [bacterium]
MSAFLGELKMNMPAVITMLICLGLPFVYAVLSHRDRAFKRKAVFVAFIAMLLIRGSLPLTVLEGADVSGEEDTEDADGYDEGGSVCGIRLDSMLDLNLDAYTRVACASSDASNFLKTKKNRYPAENMFDGDPETCWQDGEDGYAEGTEIYALLEEPGEIKYIIFYNGRSISDQDAYEKNGRVRELTIVSGEKTGTIELPDMMGPTVIALENWGEVSEFHFVADSVYPGTKYEDTCISEIEFYR